MKLEQVTPVVNFFQSPTGEYQYAVGVWSKAFGPTYYENLYTVPSGKVAYLKSWGIVVYVTEPAETFNHVCADLVFELASGEWAVLARVDVLQNIDDYGESKSGVADLYLKEGDKIKCQMKGMGADGYYAVRVFAQFIVY